MKYIMKSGILYANEKITARLKGIFTGPEKKVYSADGSLAFQVDIRYLSIPPVKTGDVRFKEYVVFNTQGKECAVAKPDYAEGDDPAVAGWPVCRMPRADHAKLFMDGKEYQLIMQNSQNYTLSDPSGKTIVQIFHRGLAGGWNIEAPETFTPELLCAIFTFCRYIERENEFPVT